MTAPADVSTVATVSTRYSRWLYALFVIPPTVAILAIVVAPDPHGHWSEHLLGAYLDGAQLGLLVVLASMLGARKGQSMGQFVPVLLLISLVVITVGILYELIGNYQVAQSIWQTRGNPGFGDGYAEGHDRAETGDLLVMVGGAVFAFIVGLARRVPLIIAGLALVMVIVPPPFVWPALGVLMLLLYGLTSETGFTKRSNETTTTARGT
jgi:hypothetical protein